MTAREKLEKDRPSHTGPEYFAGCCGCPHLYGYLDRPDYCMDPNYGTEKKRCNDCWDREIPEEKKTIYAHVGPDFTGGYVEESSTIVQSCEPGKPNLELKVERKILDSGNRRPKIICISGKAQHGKDTTAGYLKEFLEEKDNKVLIAHYGDLVKYISTTFFDWDGQKDERGRSILQYVGTDAIRTKTPDFWVKFIKDVLDHFPDKWDYVLIPDCRFPNEVDYLKEHGYSVTHVRVIRSNFISPLTIEQQKHASEIALDAVIPDVILFNTFGLEELRHSVRNGGWINNV